MCSYIGASKLPFPEMSGLVASLMVRRHNFLPCCKAYGIQNGFQQRRRTIHRVDDIWVPYTGRKECCQAQFPGRSRRLGTGLGDPGNRRHPQMKRWRNRKAPRPRTWTLLGRKWQPMILFRKNVEFKPAVGPSGRASDGRF